MHKDQVKALLSFVFPLMFAAIFLILNFLMQPTPLKFDSAYRASVLPTVKMNKLYNLDGDILAYPKVRLLPHETLAYSGDVYTIQSISELKSDEYIVGDEYVATVKIQFSLPKEMNYGIILPGQFCEYTLFCNGKLFSYTEAYEYKQSDFPAPKYIPLPYSNTGFYQLVLNISSPIKCPSGSYGTILIGRQDHVAKVETAERTLIFFLLAFVFFILVECIVQAISFRKDRVLHSFLLFVLASIFRILFSDNVVAIDLFGHLPYSVGTFCRAIMNPIFLLALMFHIYTIYRKYFPRNFFIAGAATLLIPIIDDLTFGSIFWLSPLSSLCLFMPYGICIYVIYCAITDDFFYSSTVILGITSLLSGSLIDFISSQNIVPGKYSYSYGIVFISFAQLINLAKTYAEQDEAEISMTEELKKQMEAMQTSENAFLNAQMKPHFLYNTLNTIADLCVTDSDKARSLIASLKDYVAMVISLDNMEETVSLAKELKLARTYYKIEKERFPAIEFFEELPIRIPNIQMPPLVLQPLIENAIKHGVRKSTRSGVIIVRIKEKPDYVQFQVSDNGAGMTDADIQKMFIVPKENKSVGIYNINKRLANLYGTGLKVESTVDLGTCISFIIPKGKNVEHIKHGAKRIE